MLKAINIKWDTDGDEEVLQDLPTEMIIPDDLEEMYKKDKEYALEEISDWLSDETGFCHAGFELEKMITKESVDGLFVGRAAWNAKKFNALIRDVRKSYNNQE